MLYQGKRQMSKKNIVKILLLVAVFVCGAFPVMAQSVSINLADAPTGTATGRIFSVLALITILSLAPSILIMMTSFTRIAVVFSITRSALSTNSAPSKKALT